MNESPPVFYRTLSPLGPLPCFLSLQFIIMQSRAMGIADYILPLGDLFPVSVPPPKIRPSDPKSSLFDPKSGLSDPISDFSDPTQAFQIRPSDPN